MFDLYGEDFLSYEAARGARAKSPLVAFLNRFRAPGQELPESARLKYMPYDWTPNDQAIP
jgi:hypothetical protein